MALTVMLPPGRQVIAAVCRYAPRPGAHRI